MTCSLDAAVDYARRRYGSNRNRHWWGIAHRARLINTGEYVKTSQQTRYVVKWADPELRTKQTMQTAWARVVAIAARSARES